MIEKFQPSIAQLTRLSQDAYDNFAAISLARLQQIEITSPIDVVEVPESDREDAIAALRLQSEQQMAQPIEDFLDGGMLADLEEQIADTIAVGILLAMLLALGGVQKLRQSAALRGIVLDTRRILQGNLRAAQRTADKIGQGQLTPNQIKDQARRRSLGIRAGFSSAGLLDRMVSGIHNEAKRSLTSPHPCPSCPQYDTKGIYIPIGQVVPVGTYCLCQSNCACKIVTRFSLERALQDLLGGNLLNRVQRRSEFMAQVEERYLRQNGWL